MGGMFRSSDTVTLLMPYPFESATDVGGGTITYGSVTSAGSLFLNIFDGSGSRVSSTHPNATPSYVSATDTGVGFYKVVLQSSYFSAHPNAGEWVVSLDSDPGVVFPSRVSFQWGGIVDTLANGADSANSAKTLATNAYKFDEGGTSGKLTVYDVDGTTPLAHWLCYSDAARTTLATTWASVVARGPSTPGA